MAKIKKSLSDKEKELMEVISDAKKKLAKLQDKQKNEMGDLVFKHGLNEFPLTTLDDEFKKLSVTLSQRK